MIAVISDIHGNFSALEAVFDEINKLGCQQVVSLGDVAGYYCMINECIELLRKRRVKNILGNHDRYLLDHAQCPRSTSANKCLDYQQSVILPENRNWLNESKHFLSFDQISMVHAGWNDPLDEYLYQLSAGYFADKEFRFFFSGHTHVQILANLGQKIYCNPGSVGQPRDGDHRAAFATYDSGDIKLHRVDYKIDTIASAMKVAGFEPRYYENLYGGTKIGGSIARVEILD